MKKVHLFLYLSLLAISITRLSAAVPELIASDPGRKAVSIDFGDFTQSGGGGVFAAWVADDPASESLVRFYKFDYQNSAAWNYEQIAAISDVGTSPSTVSQLPIKIIAGDYSNDSKVDLTVMYNSFITTTSLHHYQRSTSGFSPDDASETSILSEGSSGRQSIFWQGIGIGNLTGDGVQTLVTSDINYNQPHIGHANPNPANGFGPQRIYLHRRSGNGAFGTETSVSDYEFGRENSEETDVLVGDISGDGNPDVVFAENVWNRSPGWGHQVILYAMSANGGVDAGPFTAGDETNFFDDPEGFLPNALKSVGIIFNEFLWLNAWGQMGITAMAISDPTNDLTRDGKADMVVARFDEYAGATYGDPPFSATSETDNLGALCVMQVASNGALVSTPLEVDVEDYGAMRWNFVKLGDVNDDGFTDLVAVAKDLNTGLWHLFLYEWNKTPTFIAGNGAPSSNFPNPGTYVPPASPALLNSTTRSDLITPSLIPIVGLGVGNTDADSAVEIVFATEDGNLYEINGAIAPVATAQHWELY